MRLNTSGVITSLPGFERVLIFNIGIRLKVQAVMYEDGHLQNIRTGSKETTLADNGRGFRDKGGGKDVADIVSSDVSIIHKVIRGLSNGILDAPG